MLDNDFKKWHLSFIVPYTMTYLLGLVRSRSVLAYRIHPLVGMASVAIPLLVYLILPNKKLIRRMIINNFNLKGNGLMKVAKISTQVIIGYFIMSVLSGVLLNNGLYINATGYRILGALHGISKFLVPLAMVAHISARLAIKAKYSAKRA